MIRKLLACIGAVTLFMMLTVYAVTLPTVYYSWSGGYCVKVVGGGSCESLPGKHYSEWVR